MKKLFLFHPMQLIVALSLICFASGCETETKDVTILNSAVKIAQTGEISAEACTIRFTPDKQTIATAFAIGSESDRAKFEDGTLTSIQTQEGNEEFSKNFSDLNPDADYIVFARSYNANGLGGPVTSLQVKKQADEFAVEKQFVLDRSAAFSIECTADYYGFRFAAGKAADRAAFAAGTLENEQKRSELTKYTATCFDLNPGEEYIFFIEGFDRAGRSTGVLERPFTTLSEEVSPSVKINIDKIDIFHGEYSIVPNDACKMAGVLICQKGSMKEMIESDMHWQGDVLTMLTSWMGIDGGFMTVKGDGILKATFLTPDLKTDNALEAFVILYDEDYEPCGVAHFDFSTPAFDDKAGKATATISVNDITPTGATYTIEGGANAFAYMYDTVDADWYDEFKKGPGFYENYLGDLLFASGKYWHYGNAQVTFTEQGAEPSKRYYAAVIPMNVNGPQGGWGEAVLIEYTTTQNQ